MLLGGIGFLMPQKMFRKVMLCAHLSLWSMSCAACSYKGLRSNRGCGISSPGSVRSGSKANGLGTDQHLLIKVLLSYFGRLTKVDRAGTV